MATTSARNWVSKHWNINFEKKTLILQRKFTLPSSPFPPTILQKFLLEIKKQEVASSISRHKGILNKNLCKNLF